MYLLRPRLGSSEAEANLLQQAGEEILLGSHKVTCSRSTGSNGGHHNDRKVRIAVTLRLLTAAFDRCQEALPEALTHFDVSPTGKQLPSLRELEDDYVHRVLAITENNKTQAARILGIHPTSLLRRLKRDHAAD